MDGRSVEGADRAARSPTAWMATNVRSRQSTHGLNLGSSLISKLQVRRNQPCVHAASAMTSTGSVTGDTYMCHQPAGDPLAARGGCQDPARSPFAMTTTSATSWIATTAASPRTPNAASGTRITRIAPDRMRF